MQLHEIVDLFMQNYAASQSISILQIYCQKFMKSSPIFDFTVNALSGSLGSTFNCKLEIDGEIFETRNAPNKSDSKRACARAAVKYFESLKIAYFVERELHYPTVMNSVAQMAGVEQPVIKIYGGNPSFQVECNFNLVNYRSPFDYTSKSIAKNDICKICFESIIAKDQKLFDHIYLNNPALVTSKNSELEVRHCKKG